MSSPPVVVLIEYRAQPGRAGTALSELASLIATVVREESDCSGIRMLQDLADPARILLQEEWSSREAYLGPHFETPHLKAFIEGAATLFTGPPKIEFWSVASEHSAGGRPD